MNLRKVSSPITFGLVAMFLFYSSVLYCAKAGYAHDGHLGQKETYATYERMQESYSLPDVTLLNQDGEKVRLKELVDSGNPVMLNFIFTTCTTICPILSAGFSRFQVKMGKEAANVTMISISTDPDHDTPPVMKEYFKRYGAKPGWEFLTGSTKDIAQVIKAFDAKVGNKMDHYPLKFLRAPGADKWVRIKGLIGASGLLDEYHKLRKTTPDSFVPRDPGKA